MEDWMTIAFIDGPVITGDGRILEHATVLVEDGKGTVGFNGS